MRFIGKSIAGQTTHEYSVIRFIAGKDTIWFNSPDNLIFVKDEAVPVLYQKDTLSQAKVDTFTGLWGYTLIYVSPPLLILIILFFHPELMPARSKIYLKIKKPFFQIV